MWDVPGAQVWEFKGERVVRVRTYTDSASFPASVDEEEHQKRQRDEAEQDKEDKKDKEEPAASPQDEGPSKSEDHTDQERRDTGQRT